MDIVKTKEKLIHKIQTSNDEVLLIELLDVLEQHDVVLTLNDEQQQRLERAMQKEIAGKGEYQDAREFVQQMKDKLKK